MNKRLRFVFICLASLSLNTGGLLAASPSTELREQAAATMRRVWSGLAKTVQPDGRVGGVSAGTGPSGKEGYAGREVGTYTWGTGAFLLAACAYAKSELPARG